MKKDDIMKLAREAGFEGMTDHPAVLLFAHLIAAHKAEVALAEAYRMTDKDKAMQQALELIERLNMRGWILADFEDEVYATIDSLKAALEQPVQPVQELVGDEWTPCMKLPVVVHVRQQRPGEAHVSTREGITPVKPDDLIMRGVSGEEYPIGRAIFEQTYSLNTTPPQQQAEPVAWDKPSASFNDWWDSDRRRDNANPFEKDSAAYWAWAGWKAAQREWVGLTEFQFAEIYNKWNDSNGSTPWGLYHAIEKALKAKNHG